MITYTFVVNPAAGKGSGKKLLPLLVRSLDNLKLDYEIKLTENPGHGRDIARNSEADVVVAVGGDGTVNEVANGLIGTGKTLGILPTGSGNDLVRSLGIAKDLRSALQLLMKGGTQLIDTGTVECRSKNNFLPKSGNSGARHFVNAVGVGFDAAVAERTRHFRHISGTLLYLVALFQALWKYRPPQFTIRVGSETTSAKRFLIAVGNGKCEGGGFYLTPDAELDDGLLDVCIVDALPIPRIIALIPELLRAKHLNARGIAQSRATEISISSPEGFFVHADGELVGEYVNEVRVGVVKRSLNVIRA